VNLLRRAWDNLIFILAANCDQATHLLSESFERRLTIVEWLALHGHLLSCKTGRRFRRQIIGIRAYLRECSGEKGNSDIPDEAITFHLPTMSRERIRARLDEALREESK